MNLILAILAGALLGAAGGIFLGRRFFADNTRLEALQSQLADWRVKEGVLHTQKQELEAALARQTEYFAALREGAKAQFGELANKLLKEKSLELSAKNSEILAPLAGEIEKFKTEIKNLEKETIDKNARLETQLAHMSRLNQNLAQEASNLTQALQSKKAQGNLGEMILEDILQAGGLKESVHYVKQHFLRGEEGRKNYPDFVINLPDNRRVIVDSKMSLADYAKWVNETDEIKKEQHLKAHAEALKNHIKNLSAKEYQTLLKENGLDFVIMFIPVEYAYISALDYDKDLSAFAGEKRVAIATASSLFPIIRIIEGLWRIDTTSKNMAEIARNGEEMHKKAVAFLGEMARLGANMQAGRNIYDEAMIKLHGRGGIISRAQALEKLGVRTTKSLKNVAQEDNEETISPAALPPR
ncbi:MAG: DNA recombination protein RmuC [Elusimicrobiota bacterium]|jgi:DNA recombination protein RmuC|nr:DNA recombination protein RmuC [Elusimicrobiota bacterium]